MDQRTKGAWVIHHTRKLQEVSTQDFDQTAHSGKCGLLLSAIAGDAQATLEKSRVDALAKANGISPKSELASLLQELERQRIIQVGSTEIEVLGLTTSKVLDHTARIFDEGDPTAEEIASIQIAEVVSERPCLESELIEWTGDNFHISKTDVQDFFKSSESIGFFDTESDRDGRRLVFNGNIFRTENVAKINTVLNGLIQAEAEKVREFNGFLASHGCVAIEIPEKMLGADLFKKLHSIGLYDVSQIGNELGMHYFITRPAAFSKFTSSIAEDAFDLAKALVSALSYGMMSSPQGRGKIQMLPALMSRLIAGHWVGPATAIGKDYQALELRGVVQLRHARGSMYEMRLLKPDVGKLALSVIQEGDVAPEATILPAATVTIYVEPEINRSVVRKQIKEPLKRGVGSLLSELRTGGIK